ncbi:MAG: HAD superfamily hydrolase (TIGR01509 family) [Paracoccaceae bacterium]
MAAKKPAPDVYLLALERMGLEPEQAMAFEDTRNGMLSARAAGLLVCISPTVYSADDDFS